jgi:exodeoxyribonuclease VII large subunit
LSREPEGELDLFQSSSPVRDAGSHAPAGSRDDPGASTKSGPTVWTVSGVNRAARVFLGNRFSGLWVGGELANWTRARSGHRYFTLRDEQAQLRCVMWRSDAERLPTEPEDGMRLRVFGALTVYEARGEFQLSVRRLEGEGEEGLWRLAFDRIRRRLQEEGLLDPARKRSPPRFPVSVGVVTSLEGAALHDVLTVIRRRAPWTRVVVRGSRVQGEGAASELADAIRALGRSGEVEVLITGRGGGSTEDLWAFNEEPVARAIAECPVPVISGVGHEVDVTISDLVADVRAATPSAAAEAAVEDRDALLELLRRISPRLGRGLRDQTDRRRVRLSNLSDRARQGVWNLILPRRVALERRLGRLESGIDTVIRGRREVLGAIAGKVEALSPLSTLQRGYAIPLDSRSRVLRRASQFRVGEPFDLVVVDGRIQCETREIRRKGEK